MQTFIFWVYSAKKKVASSIRYGHYHLYWPNDERGNQEEEEKGKEKERQQKLEKGAIFDANLIK